MPVGPLSPSAAEAVLASALGPVATRDPALADLARACAYLPLALRLGAAAAMAGPPASLAALAGALSTGSASQALEVTGDSGASVRASFDISYRSLDPLPRRLFRRLGLVPAGAEVSAAAVLLG